MRLSLNWLKDYVDPKLSVDELVHRLTMAGLEVEEVQQAGNDTVFDLEITPNRPDCLCTIGLAREIAAITAKNLKIPKIKKYKTSKKGPFTISIEDRKDCPQYSATYLDNVTVETAPGWMQDRLQSVGVNSINNAVDITNFVLMEQGQPLHVFDADKIVGRQIIVRRAKAGESIVTLDGVERKLNPGILVIADAKRPIAIAGIMGGLDTSVTPQTKNVLLESAQFEMGVIRRGGRSLGLKSDASYRFERGVDAAGVVNASDRATDLLAALCRAKFKNRTVAAISGKMRPHLIKVSIKEITDLLGTPVTAVHVKSSLSRLGLIVKQKAAGQFQVAVPGFRGDLRQPVDIIEEVARIIGYDRLEVSFPHIQVANITPKSRPRQVKKEAARILQAQGVHEIITFSLINQKDLQKTNLQDLAATGLVNALSAQHNLLRPSLIPSLLTVALTNVNRGQRELRLFEIGKIYSAAQEQDTLGVLLTGKRTQDWRNHSKEMLSFYDLKGLLEAVAMGLGRTLEFKPVAHPSFDASRCAQLSLGGRVIGVAGAVDKKVLAQWDLKLNEVYAAQMDLSAFYATEKQVLRYEPISEFPVVTRDVSVAVKKDISYAQIKTTALRIGGDILKEIHLIEEYTGDKIQAGYRGLVFSLVYQSPERTLRDDEVNAVHQKILQGLANDCGANQR